MGTTEIPVDVEVLRGDPQDLHPAEVDLTSPRSAGQDHALAELHRVIRPGGELRFHGHVIPNCQPKRLLLQAADHSGF